MRGFRYGSNNVMYLSLATFSRPIEFFKKSVAIGSILL